MKEFQDELWVEHPQPAKQSSAIQRIKERIARLGSSNEKGISVEDRYELESVRTLTFESVSAWILKNKTSDYDGAFLVRMRHDVDVKFPITVGIMFLKGKEVALGRDHMKKIIHCTFLDQDLNDSFQGGESVILK